MSCMQQGKKQAHSRRDVCMLSQNAGISGTRQQQVILNHSTNSECNEGFFSLKFHIKR